ncbi:MAG: bifunctional D-glycero-beta-D-manno-heptose-7-phosphate kinase/D-glycero-beta-D-manno-heptose 1-phosphate adenylyltransferase HldE [Gammaproteobacteria bacterium]|nr:bifunctional D-glycero-beta-D-manno-heptose-7-phosphate kinase/D-glycero-beta-D-manno-heptose 1-phosphate adenylyltransferase HldE [Gammaproteobacteria bacterium]MYB38814.1 bifunctional D-glycero-beta-D-manno-heptose-7-phosphate kinase/D-glycero-beta-D-manno-heptose 1-phosphate adenylyltransferase HldE [Gammaproteobacteria bacterium]
MPHRLPSGSAVHVLVVGDIMLDRYQYGETTRLSQEAPVPVVRVDSTEDRPGGAANVALNVVSLGARCTLVGAVGNDDAGRTITQMLNAADIETDLVVIDDWPTAVKQRVVSKHQQLLRTDFEASTPAAAAREVAERAQQHFRKADALVVEDYDKGAIRDPQAIVDAARRRRIPIIADPKFKPFAQYRGVSVLKPNRREFRKAVGFWPRESDLPARARALVDFAGVDAMVVTRGSEGMTLFEPDGSHLHIPAVPVDVYDETGAGDTVAATLGIGLALGWSRRKSARIANVAGGIVCTKVGTAAVTLPELNSALASEERPDHGYVSRPQLLDVVARARSRGQRIVFTNGCFDILHAGHVGYLDEARKLGDRLIVAVNDDASVRRLKGAGRPVNRLERRTRVLEGLSSVDWVVAFDEDTPEALLAEVRPDVLAKGGDYTEEEVVGGDFVRTYGGDVRVLSLIEDCSTSAIVESIRSA